MRVPFLDLRAAHAELREEIDDAVLRVTNGGWYLLGEELTAFESEFAAFTGARHCIGVGNGLDALHLSLRALGVGPGDEVIVPSHTFIATWLAVSQVGATPVPVEPDPGTYILDPERVADAIGPRTRALLPVHLYGQPADMDALREVADRHGLLVLEDAAQAHGARWAGRTIGTHGHAAAWSFYPGKNLGAYGDGGAITTSDDALAERLRALRNYGSRTKYVHEVQGINSRLDDLQAAILRVKLRHLGAWNERRRRAAQRYLEAFADLPITLPVEAPDAESVWHLFVIRSLDRDRLLRELRADGVETLIHYPIPPHRQGAYQGTPLAHSSLPIAERLAGEVLSLPIGPHLTDEQQDQAIGAVRARAVSERWQLARAADR